MHEENVKKGEKIMVFCLSFFARWIIEEKKEIGVFW